MPFCLAYFDIYIYINNLHNPKRDEHIVTICRKSIKCQYRPVLFFICKKNCDRYRIRFKKESFEHACVLALCHVTRAVSCVTQSGGARTGLGGGKSQIHSRSLIISQRSFGQWIINREGSGNENLKPAKAKIFTHFLKQAVNIVCYQRSQKRKKKKEWKHFAILSLSVTPCS